MKPVSSGRVLVRALLITVSVFFFNIGGAQKIYVNTSESVYQLVNNNGQSRLEKIPTLCNLTQSRGIYSIAIYKDTLYYNSGKNLFRVVPDKPGSCEFLAPLPGSGMSFNCMAADKFGLVYMIAFDTRILYRYHVLEHEFETLGVLPVAPAGDLMFYKSKLLYATVNDGIFEINLDQPSESTQFMHTQGYSFYGLLSFPFDCNRNKIYGISLNGAAGSTDLVEIDLEHKQVLSKLTTFPYPLYDAASSVDNGNTMGLTLDSVEVKTELCKASTGTDMRLVAFTAVDGPVNYMIDGNLTSQDGKFKNLSPGSHSVRLENSKGCRLDTVITVAHLKDAKPLIGISKEDLGCMVNSGKITIDLSGDNSPYEINFRGEGFRQMYNYDRLSAGTYPILIRNEDGCVWDTTVSIVSDCDTLFMPNAFTPNGDGHNEVIRPVFGTGVKEISFMVFNRLGEKVFESVDGKGWDGKIHANPQPSGTYAFMIRYKNNTGKQLLRKGTFMLIR